CGLRVPLLQSSLARCCSPSASAAVMNRLHSAQLPFPKPAAEKAASVCESWSEASPSTANTRNQSRKQQFNGTYSLLACRKRARCQQSFNKTLPTLHCNVGRHVLDRHKHKTSHDPVLELFQDQHGWVILVASGGLVSLSSRQLILANFLRRDFRI